MRVPLFASFALASLVSCAPPAEKGTGPVDGTPALVDFTSESVTLGGVEMQGPVSVLVRDARGAVISASSVTWTSDDPGIVDVSGNGATGTLVARRPGSTIIRAKAGSAGSQIPVKVLSVRGVAITQPAVSLRAGANATVSATVDAEDGAIRTVKWSSDNSAIVTVSSQGVLTGVSMGTTTVRAIATGNPQASATVPITVTAARAVLMSPQSMTLWVGDSDALRGDPEVDFPQSRDLMWTSANPTIASVSASGVVTALSVGTTKIRATSVADARIQGEADLRVLPARVVAISPVTSTVNIGTSRTLVPNVTIEPGLSTAVTWRSTDPSIVSVSNAGVVTGVSLGTVSITAVSVADTMRRGNATVTVTPVIRGVTVSPATMTLNAGETDEVVANVNAEGTLPRTVTWRSANPTVATVSAAGDVTGVAAGATTITALSTVDTTKRASLTVTVRPAPIIGITPRQATFAMGDQRTFSALVNVEPGQSSAVIWRSSNSSVASVSQSGVVTGVSLGAATITVVSVEDTLRRASAAVTIAPIVRSISVTPATNDMFIAQTRQLQATVVADEGLSQAVLWRSSDPTIATVNSSGVITSVSIGNATITALAVADTSKKATSAVSITSRPVTITVAPAAISVPVAGISQLNALVTGDPGISLAATWTTSSSAVATVSAQGLVTGIAQGTATITARSQADPTKTATATVTVGGRLATSWTAGRASGALYEDVLSIVNLGASAAFAVNAVGDIFRWNGSTWTLSTTGSNFGTQFTAVHGTSSSNVIAVGTGGIAARFDGSTWTPMSTGTTKALLDVFIDGSGSGYASGAGGTVLKLSGSTWSAMNTGSTEALNSVWAGGGTVVAVGTGGEVLRWANGVWTTQSVPTAESLYGVSGTSATNVVAVGAIGTVLRFNGTSWSRVNSSTDSDLYSVDGSAANGGRMYIGSDNGLMQLDGTTLTATSTPYKPRIFSVAVDASGTALVGGQRGAVFRGTSGSFSTLSLSPDLLDVWSTSATNAWAVGEFGFIYRNSGAGWVRQTTPTTVTLNTVWAASATDAFAGGENGTVLRWNGSAWTTLSLPSTSSVYAIWGSSASNVFAVTAAGQVFRFDGSSWTLSTSTNVALWAVYGSGPSEVYVSGESGRVMRFNGSTWSTFSSSSVGTLGGLWASSASNIMAVGSDASGVNGLAYRYDGSSWLPQNVGTNRVLMSVWGVNGNDVYVTGELGTLLHFNGSSWSTMSSGTSDLLWSVTGAPGGSGGAFAVGYNSTIVAGSGSAGMSAAMMRMTSRNDLEPSAQARATQRDASPLPNGAARRIRKRMREDAAVVGSRTGLELLKYGRRSDR